MSRRKLITLLAALTLVAPLMFYGCSGDDGAPGAPGAPGATGDTGPAGAVTNTNESCMVCHTTGRIADISDQSGGEHFAKANTLPNLTVGITDVTATGGNLVVSFTVKIDNNAPYTKLADNSVYFFAADLVPAGTVASALDGMPQRTAQFDRWAFERTGTYGRRDVSGGPLFVDNYVFGTFDNTGAPSGNYTYTFGTKLGTTTAYDNAQHFNPADIQRVWVRVAGTPSGTYTGGVAFRDITLDNTVTPIAVDNANIGYLARQFVTIEACQKCHGPKNQVMDHGSSYIDMNGCVICHSPITDANNGGGGESLRTDFFMVDLWMGKMIHRIHAGKGSTLTNKKQADAEFPQDVRDCVVCHSNPSGKDLGPVGTPPEKYGAGNQLDNWKNHPTAAYCGTCHVGFPNTSHLATYKVAGGPAHPGGTSTTSDCASCHPATGAAGGFSFPVATVHNSSPEAGSFNANPKNVPEFNVAITMSPALDNVKTFYAAGDNVTITVTLKKHSDNTAVPGTVYTAAQDNVGVSGGGLSTANLQVYGPRALPKPIFAPTDNTQGHSLFVGKADKSGTVATDNTGFKYRFTVPKGLAAGTYMARFEGQDFGSVTDNNYVTSSTAFIKFQVGSATVTKKVAGDSCTNCHGATVIHLEGLHPHNAPFDTDVCNACHDYSGGYAANLSNRVHAVHSANTLGDMKNTQAMQTTSGGFNSATIARDWSDIGYPQSISNCSACHASTIGAANTAPNTSYRSVVHEVSCLGCHGDNIFTDPATNHMLQSGGDFPAVK